MFRMIKLRSMVKGADNNKVDSTSSNDNRITKVGHFIRKYKIDELPQLLNVLQGDMSLVGPRPNVQRETDLYTAEEQYLLSVPPGITDLASIVFADEGEILANSRDPDLDYNQLIRPWKSRIGLICLRNNSIFFYFQMILLTVLSIFNRDKALEIIARRLGKLGASPQLVQIARRNNVTLSPYPPPGSDQVVQSRQT